MLKLTPFQISELSYKVEVMQDDGCEDSIAGSYGFTDETLGAFAEKVKGSTSGKLCLTEMEALAAYGEFSNCADIALDNGEESDARKFRDALKRISEAYPFVLD